MPQSLHLASTGALTYAEIFQQPALWHTTLERVRAANANVAGPVLLTGAGSSAHAASAVAAGWPGAVAVPATDLLIGKPPFHEGLLISLARSGDSPESVGVIQRMQRNYPQIKHLVITCNADGQLAKAPGVEAILLDPRTNDRSLVMTSSFSNLVLGGLCLRNADRLTAELPSVALRVEALLPQLDQQAKYIAQRSLSRVLVLACAALQPLAHEVALKITEMSAGAIIALPETYLGLRHGPMAFLRSDALVLCFQSSDEHQRRYEKDLLQELRQKQLGRIVAVAQGDSPELFDEHIPASAPALPDELRTPFEVIFAQLIAYHLSLFCGMDPDQPSPAGVIARVVQGVTVYP